MCSMRGEPSCVKLSHLQLAFRAPVSQSSTYIYLLSIHFIMDYTRKPQCLAVRLINTNEYSDRQTDRRKKNSDAFNLQTSHERDA